MGADIHTIVQIKKGRKWVTIAKNVADGRNYALFGLLAGVRGHDGPVIPLRGLPSGIKEIEGADHSFTWYTLRELMVHGYVEFIDFASEIIVAMEEMGETALDYENVRVVMGFDS